MAQQLEPIARMVAQLSRLPGIGQKSAQRLAYHIIGMPLEDVRELASALYQGRKAIRYCAVCGNYATGELCDICADERRRNGQICVVRDPRDVAAIERMHDFHGSYHVLHGTLSPMDGIGPDDIRTALPVPRSAAAALPAPCGTFPHRSKARPPAPGRKTPAAPRQCGRESR